jgi:hypothetical protein
LSSRDGELARENRRLRARIAELDSPSADAALQEPESESGGSG